MEEVVGSNPIRSTNSFVVTLPNQIVVGLLGYVLPARRLIMSKRFIAVEASGHAHLSKWFGA